MRKIIALLLSLTMVVTLAACSGTSGSKSKAASGQLVIGSITEPTSSYMTGWDNNATSQGIRAMIHGYATVVYSPEGYVIDPMVVKDYDVTFDNAGNKTYTFTLHEDLTWNDGTKITAKDYVFSAMLYNSPEFKALETNLAGGDVYIGGNEFFSGETKTFAGIRLLGDYKFSATIKAEELPYYFDLTYALFDPMPMALLAPGVEITDNGSGATITDNFTTDLLRETCMNPETGYRYNTKLTCGPYQLDNYDAENKSVTITVNPKFKGTYDNVKPQIQKLIFKYVTKATMIDELATGAVDLLTGVNGGETISSGLDLVDQKKVGYTTYLRAGYGKIVLSCDFGPTQFVAVRQAIAHSFDRNEFARLYTGGYGIAVHGYYGASQWEYQNNKDYLDSVLNQYTYNLDEAKRILIEDGWTLNSKGAAFVEGVDEYRCKMVDGKLMELVINWASSENNPVSDMIAANVVPEAAKVGIKIIQSTMDFPTLQVYLAREGVEATYHMYNLATGFNPVIAPWYYYSTDPAYFGTYNSNFITDPELEAIATSMKLTDPEDKDAWAEKWCQFQVRWNSVLPDIPLYSDEYHEFFNPKLENYTPDALWQWRYALVRANVK